MLNSCVLAVQVNCYDIQARTPHRTSSNSTYAQRHFTWISPADSCVIPTKTSWTGPKKLAHPRASELGGEQNHTALRDPPLPATRSGHQPTSACAAETLARF
jgi:hypothetical protein